jgi:hypothetical protein
VRRNLGGTHYIIGQDVFVTSKLRAADSDGETQFVNVVAFDDSVKSMLLAFRSACI